MTEIKVKYISTRDLFHVKITRTIGMRKVEKETQDFFINANQINDLLADINKALGDRNAV